MCESGIGPGVRANRCGTWSLLTFLLLVFAPAVGGPSLVWWLPLVIFVATTLGALGFGIAGLFVRGQRTPAVYGLLKLVIPVIVTLAYVLFFLSLSSMSFD